MRVASWSGAVLASSDRTQRAHGREHFPPDSVRWEHLLHDGRERRWGRRSICRLRIAIDDRVLADAAWYHPASRWRRRRIDDHVTFGEEVEVTTIGDQDA